MNRSLRHQALILAAASAAAFAIPSQALASADATTRFTEATVGANSAGAGGAQYQNVQFDHELVTVGRGYPLLLEPTSLNSNNYHTSFITNANGAPFFSDAWSSSLGSAAITLNEYQTTEQGLIYSNLNDSFAVDSPSDSSAIRNSTNSLASWLIETSSHEATNSLYLKLHGVLESSSTGDRWVMAAGKGVFTNSGSQLGSLSSPFKWLLGFDGGAPSSRPDFFSLTIPSDWSITVNDFVVGMVDFSLDVVASHRFSAPDNQTTMSLESTFNCAAYNASCLANTMSILDPVPPSNSVPAPLPLAGAVMAYRSSRRLRARIAQSN
ncbi:MAG: hypothetical protein ACO3B3_08520 [Cyanobium sp.]